MSNDLYREFLNILTLTFVLGIAGVIFREFSHNAWFRNLGRAIALGAFATWAMFGWHAVEENSHLRQQLHHARASRPMSSQNTSLVSDIHIERNGMTIDWRRDAPLGQSVFANRSEF